MPILDIQERYRELGRIRLGKKGDKYPVKLDTFRFTSPDRSLIERVAATYGGTVAAWESPRGSEWEVVTDTDRIECLVPPQRIQEGQHYELWGKDPKHGDKAAVGLLRRCNGKLQTTGEGCVCDPDDRECKPRTHLAVMLPQIPGLGVWRVTSGGFNAARELPIAAELLSRLAAEGAVVEAVLSMRHDRAVSGGQVHRFVVPQLDITMTAAELIASLPQGVGERVLTAAPGRAAAVDGGRPTLPPAPAAAALPSPVAPIPTPDDEDEPPAVVEVTDDDLATLRTFLTHLPADSETMSAWETYCRTLFDLMLAAKLWHVASDGTDPLHVALHNQHRAEDLGDLRKAQLVAFTKRAHAAATKKLEG